MRPPAARTGRCHHVKRAKRFLDYLFVIGQDAARNGLFLKILIAAIGPANNPLRTILGCSFNTKESLHSYAPSKNPLATWFRASTPYRIQLLLFVVAVLVALLPASVIYYLLLMIAGGVVIFTLYKVFHQSLLAATLLLIAGVILVLPLMLIGIMGVVLIIAIYPTMLNLWASWLIAGLRKTIVFAFSVLSLLQ